jgi:hypothetical protein
MFIASFLKFGQLVKRRILREGRIHADDMNISHFILHSEEEKQVKNWVSVELVCLRIGICSGFH